MSPLTLFMSLSWMKAQSNVYLPTIYIYHSGAIWIKKLKGNTNFSIPRPDSVIIARIILLALETNLPSTLKDALSQKVSFIVLITTFISFQDNFGHPRDIPFTVYFDFETTVGDNIFQGPKMFVISYFQIYAIHPALYLDKIVIFRSFQHSAEEIYDLNHFRQEHI